MKKEKAEDLIAKLLEVTEGNGATPGEAAVAAEKAAALMATFGIDRLRNRKSRVDVGRVIVGRISRAEFWLADAAATLTGCRALAVGLGRRTKGVCFAGSEAGRSEAEAMFANFRMAVSGLLSNASRDYASMIEPGKRRVFARDFRQGCSMRVVVRSKQKAQMDAYVKEAKAAAAARRQSDGSSLVVAAKPVEDEIREVVKENTGGAKVEGAMQNPQSFESFGTLLGWKAGLWVDLSRGVICIK